MEWKKQRVVPIKKIGKFMTFAQSKVGSVIFDTKLNFYFLPAKQVLEEKAILITQEKAFEIADSMEKRYGKKEKIWIDELKHRVLIDVPEAKIIEAIGGKHDGGYFYVLPDGKCEEISKSLAMKMIKDLGEKYDF